MLDPWHPGGYLSDLSDSLVAIKIPSGASFGPPRKRFRERSRGRRPRTRERNDAHQKVAGRGRQCQQRRSEATRGPGTASSLDIGVVRDEVPTVLPFLPCCSLEALE